MTTERKEECRGNMGVVMVVPSLLSLCILALGPYADEVQELEWTRIPFGAHDLAEIDVGAWIVLIHLFSHIPPRLCTFTTSVLPATTHGFLTVLSIPQANHLTSSLLRSTPNLAALDASSTALSSLPPLVHLRILYLRNCTQVTDHILPRLFSLPLLSVIDLSGTRCTPVDPLCPFSPSTLSALFQPSIQASLSALASLYHQEPLYTLTYLLPRPPMPVPRKGIQDSFVVFTKIGNTNTLVYPDARPTKPLRHSFPLSPSPRPAFYAPCPRPLPTPFHLHRPPPPLSSLHQPPSTRPRPPPTTPASLNLQNHKALLARKGIDAFIKLRSTPSTPSQNPSIPPSTSRNPFRKPSLKPISSFPPPIPPPSLIPPVHLPRKKPKITPNPPTRSSFDWKSWGSS